LRHFITGCELSQAELLSLVDKALAIKRGEIPLPQHPGAIFTMLFGSPSLRTRLSCASGIMKMGGYAQVLGLGDAWILEHEEGVVMDGNKQEHIKEAAPVISGFSDLIGLRQCSLATRTVASQDSWASYKKADEFYSELIKYATVPVINLESNLYHPCQGMADLMTIKEFKGDLKHRKLALTWAPHPKALPLATPHSQILMPALAGMDVTLAFPQGFDLADEVLEAVGRSAAKFTMTHNQKDALKDAEVVIAKSWAGEDFFVGQEIGYIRDYPDWQMTEEKMQATKDGIFLHCLPIRRNVVASDDLLDSPRAHHLAEAENRMWTQIALIDFLLNQRNVE
jgi:N-acetylornithine carbamoyltransferase